MSQTDPFEILVCSGCGASFEDPITPHRKGCDNKWLNLTGAREIVSSRVEPTGPHEPEWRGGAAARDEANNDGGGTGKLSNPKDALGSKKLPLDLIPFTALVHQVLAHLAGACKYGKWNWRKAGVRSSIYTAACMRHIKRYEEGEDLDPETRVHNLGHAIACLNIVLDSKESGMLTDDRPPSTPDISKKQDWANAETERIQELYKDRDPRHWTIEDGPA